MSDTRKKKNLFGMSTRNQYIIMSVLMAGFLGLIAHRLSGGQKTDASDKPAPQQTGETGVPFSIDELIVVPKAQAPKIVVPPESLALNPFAMPPQIRTMIEAKEKVEEDAGENKPNPEVEAQGRALKLKGIIAGDQQRIAFINDRAVKQGDSIDGFTVVEIGERRVLIKKDATEILLELNVRGSDL